MRTIAYLRDDCTLVAQRDKYNLAYDIICSTKRNKQDGGKYYYPISGQKIFVGAECLSAP